jgi:hypothetical protein
MAIFYFIADEPVRNDEQQDCCLIVEIHAPDGVDDRWVQQAADDIIEEEFGKRLTLSPANKDEAFRYLQVEPDATHGYLEFGTGVPVFWHLLPIAG